MKKHSLYITRLILAATVFSIVAGCATTGMRSPVPVDLADVAHVHQEGTSPAPIRYWADDPDPKQRNPALDQRIRKHLLAGARKERVDALSLSGGGYNGAFGVGYLVGWSARGDRPRFDFVAGISVGALIAPFAFLGSDYDKQLVEAFDHLATTRKRGAGIIGVLFGAGGIESSEPIADAIESIINETTLPLFAAEHKKGRRLLIGTTNLDAEKPVVWDIGAIASSQIPHRVTLIRKILLASAAVPGIYPPVLINVEANGEQYDELHVDGSVTQQILLIPEHIRVPDVRTASGGTPKRNLYVIYNGNISPSYEPVKTDAFTVLRHSVPTFIKYLGRGDINRMRVVAQNNNAAYRLAAVPASFRTKDEFPPDEDYLASLVDLGFKLGKEGYWKRQGP